MKIAGVAIGGASLFYFWQHGDVTQENLKQFCVGMPLLLFVPAWLVLPLFGFPISVILLATGMKLGVSLAIGLAAVGMAVHTFAAWYIAHGFLRQRLQRWLQKTHFPMPTIPHQHQIWFTALFVTVPGLPYAVKLYALALTDLPFRRYMSIVWLFHVLNAIPFIGLGSAAVDLNTTWLLVFGALAVPTIVLTHWLKNRFPAPKRGEQ